MEPLTADLLAALGAAIGAAIGIPLVTGIGPADVCVCEPARFAGLSIALLASIGSTALVAFLFSGALRRRFAA